MRRAPALTLLLLVVATTQACRLGEPDQEATRASAVVALDALVAELVAVARFNRGEVRFLVSTEAAGEESTFRSSRPRRAIRLGEVSKKIPKVDLPQLVPFMKAMLAVRGGTRASPTSCG